MKILLDPGHGSGFAHNRGFLRIAGFPYCNEGDCNFIYAQKYLKPELEKYGHIVKMTRDKINDNPNLEQRGKMAKGYDLLLSLHTNAGGNGSGTEIWDDVNPKYSNKALADKLCEAISKVLEIPNRGVKYRKNNSGSNWYGILRNGMAKSNMIIEHCFHDNFNDVTKYVSKLPHIAQATTKTINEFYGASQAIPQTTNKTSIMGNLTIDFEQMKEHLLKNNPNPKINCSVDDLINFYIKESEIEGVRGDIAFAQAIKETGFFKFGGQVLPEQNNFAGIGATNNSPVGKGAWFESPQIGVRAQIQHLKAYASKEPLVQKCVDPRFNLVTRGIAPNAEDLNGRWAVPGKGYGESIMKIVDKMKQIKIEDKNTWSDEAVNWAIENGITDGTRLTDNATREEVVVMIKRLYELLK